MPAVQTTPKEGRWKPRHLSPKPRKSKRTAIIVLSISVLLLGAVTGVFAASYFNLIELPDAVQAHVDLWPDLSATRGVLEHAAVEAGEYRVNLNVLPTMEEGERTCNILFENAQGNHYDARLSLYRRDTGTLLAHTHRVEVGKRVEDLTLSETLPRGEYPVIGQIELFEGDTLISTLPVELTIRVTEKGAE